MKLYRVTWPEADPSACNVNWATTKRVANGIARQSHRDAVVTPVEVTLTADGIRALLDRYDWRA